jgi:MFS family permease
MTTTTQAEVLPLALPEAAAGLARYRDALRAPGALMFALPGVVGRLPMGMLSLAQVLVVVAVTGRYVIAGAVSAAGAVLFAVVTPRAARLADRYGQARVLRPQALVFAVATVGFALCALGHGPDWALLLTGCLSRGTMPSLGSMVRNRWSTLLGGSALLGAAYSLEGIADELIFVTGPALVVTLATGFHPVTAVLITAALGVAGVAGLTRQRRTEPPAMPAQRGTGSALRSRGLRVLIAMHVCLGALFTAVDLATIEFAQRHGARPLAGLLLGLYGLGSAVAGVWYGSRQWRAAEPARLRIALAAMVAGTVPLAFVPGTGWMAVALLVAGLGISATLTCSYHLAGTVVPAGQRTEGMSWLTTAASAGAALGAPLAGRLIDLGGATPGYLLASAAGLVAVLILLLRRRDLG